MSADRQGLCFHESEETHSEVVPEVFPLGQTASVSIQEVWRLYLAGQHASDTMLGDGRLIHHVIHLFLYLILHHLICTVAGASDYHDDATTLIAYRLLC